MQNEIDLLLTEAEIDRTDKAGGLAHETGNNMGMWPRQIPTGSSWRYWLGRTGPGRRRVKGTCRQQEI
jgi:hypothetical protein